MKSTNYTPPTRAKQIEIIRSSISKNYRIYCVLCNGTYTTDVWTVIHQHSKSHVIRQGKTWKKNQEEPAWKLRPDAGPDKERDDDTEGEPLIISPKLYTKKRKRSNDSATEAAVKRPKRAAKEIVMDYSIDEIVEAQSKDRDDLYMLEKKKGTIKPCMVNINRLNQPAKVTNRPIRNSNQDNIQTTNAVDFEDDNLNYEADSTDEYDQPNNFYTPEEFHMNRSVLENIVNTMINMHENDEYQPFHIERTIEEGLRAGSWALLRYFDKDKKKHYLIIKINDNNRLLQSKNIESKCFFPDIPAKNCNESYQEEQALIVEEEQGAAMEDQKVTPDDIKNEYEIKVECSEEDNEPDYSAFTYQITPDAEDAAEDVNNTDAN